MPKSRNHPCRKCRKAPYTSKRSQGKEENDSTFKKDLEDARCAVCMDYPHNAVLLLCSSHDKGCRPYMCATSYRHSNCLDQFRKAYSKSSSTSSVPPVADLSVDSSTSSLEPELITENDHPLPVSEELISTRSAGSDSEDVSVEEDSLPAVEMTLSRAQEKIEAPELSCPLCRGTVKGWTVVESAREYLNLKSRSCSHDSCNFVGTYEELRKHVKTEHPLARPQEIDPDRQRKWRRLERQREHDDVISTIRSTMPGAMVFGDYVIEGANFANDNDDVDFQDDESNWLNVLLLFQAIGPAGSISTNRNLSSRLRGFARGYPRLGLSSVSRQGLWGENINNAPGSDANNSGNSDAREGHAGAGRRRHRTRRRRSNDLT
eukprot:TRINITY_DN22242_c0_g1_i1.p1 TRINITY_DN22242_c0_g1~~TRINITY_DN22242_c0_g1_i1.p1  ORF type:complete len:376 (+),score=77.86 TRINITY_DN22242_c0_g1_i1:374-1501(+)